VPDLKALEVLDQNRNRDASRLNPMIKKNPMVMTPWLKSTNTAPTVAMVGRHDAEA